MAAERFQHEVILDRMLAAYHPEHVILAFYVNDVTRRYHLKPVTAKDMTNTRRKRVAYLLKRSSLDWVGMASRKRARTHSRNAGLEGVGVHSIAIGWRAGDATCNGGRLLRTRCGQPVWADL